MHWNRKSLCWTKDRQWIAESVSVGARVLARRKFWTNSSNRLYEQRYDKSMQILLNIIFMALSYHRLISIFFFIPRLTNSQALYFCNACVLSILLKKKKKKIRAFINVLPMHRHRKALWWTKQIKTSFNVRHKPIYAVHTWEFWSYACYRFCGIILCAIAIKNFF